MIAVEREDAARLCHALAQEMHALEAMVEALATTLVSDPEMVELYGTDFQTFDLLAQRASESGRLLARLAQGASAAEAIAGVRLERMQQRLRAAVKAA